jgi:biopolymer transport protein ExbD/biopolymer transport protein TolR
VAQLIGVLQKAGLTRIAFVTEATDAAGAMATPPGKP